MHRCAAFDSAAGSQLQHQHLCLGVFRRAASALISLIILCLLEKAAQLKSGLHVLHSAGYQQIVCKLSSKFH